MKVVCLHAFPLDESMWEGQRRVLDRLDVAMPRLYDRGSSIDGWAGQLLEEIDDELVVVGASMGGYCAYAMARRAPERVRGILAVGARTGPDSPERREQRDAMIAALRDEGVEAFKRAAPVETPPGLTVAGLVGAQQALRDRPDSGEVVASFEGPFTLMVGERDELLGAREARSIAQSAPEGRLEVVPEAGHIVSVDQPERFDRILEHFLRPLR